MPSTQKKWIILQTGEMQSNHTSLISKFTEFNVKSSMYEDGPFYNFNYNAHQVIFEGDKTIGPDFFVNKDLWPDYIVKPLENASDLAKYQKSIEDCLPRMERTLQSLYDWNTQIYTDPTKHTQQFDGLARMSETERQDYDRIIKTKAKDRLERLINGMPLELDELMENNMVVVDHGDPDEHGYSLACARVNKIYTEEQHEHF